MIDNRPLVTLDKIYKVFSEYSSLLEEIKENFKIDFYGDHGIYHWYFVYKNTQLLSQYYNIETNIFMLFSILHDSKRIDEFNDKNHSKRAALYVQTLYENGRLKLSELDLQRLIFACENHTKIVDIESDLLKDLVVQVCLDSDKLDLTRVGIKPKAKYMLTSYAKSLTLK